VAGNIRVIIIRNEKKNNVALQLLLRRLNRYTSNNIFTLEILAGLNIFFG
jgi:hypothetical protein